MQRFLLFEEVPSENDDSNLWWLGALIYIAGSVLINLGNNLIRYSHERVRLLGVSVPIWKRYWWIIGFSVFAFGNVLNFVAFMFAAQSLLVALGSIQFVSNLFFARGINKEPITRRAIIATGIIIVGNIIIVLGGNKSSKTYNLAQLKDLFLRPAFLFYLSFTAFLILIFQGLYAFLKFGYFPKTEKPNPWAVKYMPLAYAGVSAMIGTCSVTMGKALSGLVLQALDPNDQGELDQIWSWLILLLFVVITAFWLYRMNVALRKYDAMFIIPVLQSLWLLFAVLNGGIFFEEFNDLGYLDVTLFAVGIFILLCGVAVFSPKSDADGTLTPEILSDNEATRSVLAFDALDTVAILSSDEYHYRTRNSGSLGSI